MNPSPAETRPDTGAPKVTFVVPCFKLAHFLGECVDSILRQTYGDFEILIMDDASPDDTEAVARSYSDPRVRYIRNEQNLGNIRNYNKGIKLARGEYVWLISADDFLKQPYVLDRYVDLMDSHPRVGYVFSPAMAFFDGQERGVMDWTVYTDSDTTLSGHRFLGDIMNGNYVAAPTGMVRKACYDTISYFHPDLFHAGDWFLWCLFALHFDVAYLAEPMVCYRTHGENMSLALRRVDESVVRANIRLARWRLRAKAREAGFEKVVRQFDEMLGNKYANEIAQRTYHGDAVRPTIADFEEALKENIEAADERSRIRAAMYAALGDQAFQVANVKDARSHYALSLRENRFQSKIWAKRLLLGMGPLGTLMRRVLRSA